MKNIFYTQQIVTALAVAPANVIGVPAAAVSGKRPVLSLADGGVDS